jgi:hypothetical protein
MRGTKKYKPESIGVRSLTSKLTTCAAIPYNEHKSERKASGRYKGKSSSATTATERKKRNPWLKLRESESNNPILKKKAKQRTARNHKAVEASHHIRSLAASPSFTTIKQPPHTKRQKRNRAEAFPLYVLRLRFSRLISACFLPALRRDSRRSVWHGTARNSATESASASPDFVHGPTRGLAAQQKPTRPTTTLTFSGGK